VKRVHGGEGSLRWRIRSRKLAALYKGKRGKPRYPAAVLDAFLEVMGVIDAMPDVRDLYALKSLHFEQLSGGRTGQSSLRLGGQFRLVVTLERDEAGDVVIVHEIVDYH
jgi:proteic killer suppression protein